MTDKKHFNNQNRTTIDACAVSASDKQNNDINSYNIYNFYKGNTHECATFDKSKITELAIDTQMHIKDGYGVTNECVVDVDSKLRNDAIWTNPKAKVQLFTRVFQGVPDINRGGLIVPVEDQVKQGEYNLLKNGCTPISETQYPTFVPLVPCLAKTVQDPNHIVPTWEYGAQGGLPSRDIIQQTKFLQQNGYVFDQNVWKRKICS